MPQLKAVIIDFGNVISLPNRYERILKQARKFEIPEQKFLHAYRKERYLFDQGAVDVWEYWQRVMDGLPFEASRPMLQQFIDLDMADWTRLNQPLLEWQRTLPEAGYLTGLLSNLPLYYAEYFRNHFSWLESFDAVTFSCDVGAVKPEAKIYQACLESLGVTGEQALFLDDLPENVEGAKRNGMNSEIFVSFDETIPYIINKYGI